VEQAQLEVGSLTPFYQLPFQQYGFLLTNCWLKSLWHFLSHAGLHLQASGGSGLSLQWEHDTFLMDALVSLAAYTPAILQSLNCCRLYMHCLSLADISTGAGDHLHPPLYTRFSPQPPSPFFWPVEHPSAADWTSWHSILPQVFCSFGQCLLTPLGDWLHPLYHTGSFMRYDPTSNVIYLPGHASVWRVYHPCPILPATSYRVGFSQHSVSPFPPPASATHWTLVNHIGQGPLFAFGSAPAAPWHPPYLRTSPTPCRIWAHATGPSSTRTSP